MTHRTDSRNISLGPRAAKAEAGLRELALTFGLAGRKGNGSLSALLLWLADLYENAAPELVACLHAAADRAGKAPGGASTPPAHDIG